MLNLTTFKALKSLNENGKYKSVEPFANKPQWSTGWGDRAIGGEPSQPDEVARFYTVPARRPQISIPAQTTYQGREPNPVFIDSDDPASLSIAEDAFAGVAGFGDLGQRTARPSPELIEEERARAIERAEQGGQAIFQQPQSLIPAYTRKTGLPEGMTPEQARAQGWTYHPEVQNILRRWRMPEKSLTTSQWSRPRWMRGVGNMNNFGASSLTDLLDKVKEEKGKLQPIMDLYNALKEGGASETEAINTAATAGANARTSEPESKILGLPATYVYIGGGVLGLLAVIMLLKRKKTT